MDLPKFVSLLNTRSLWLARADAFEDKWEAASRALPFVGDATGFEYTNFIENSHKPWRRNLKRQLFISCWSSGNESIAMWKIYGSSGSGLSVESSETLLFSAVDQEYLEIHYPFYTLKRVDYFDSQPATFDYSRDAEMSRDKAFEVACTKRSCFDYEKEVRLVVWRPTEERSGIEIPVALERLVQRVIVSPVADNFFLDSVRTVVQRFGFTFEVRRSYLAEDPPND